MRFIKNNSGKKRLRAFSLIEIMIGMVIISVILAALAPVIVQKATVATTGGANNGIKIVEKTSDFIIEANMRNFLLKEFYAGGGGGGGSFTHVNIDLVDGAPADQEECPEYSLYINGSCVSKWNIGDDAWDESNSEDFRLGSDALPTRVYINSTTYKYNDAVKPLNVLVLSAKENAGCQATDASDFTTENALCCWNSGQLTGGCSTGTGNNNYSGCNRTLCNWKAAVSLCANWSPKDTIRGVWHLPTKTQLQYIQSNFASVNADYHGLQLCQNRLEVNPVSPYCVNNAASSPCIGTTNGYCFTSYIWGGTIVSSRVTVGLYNSDAFTISEAGVNNAMSTRCVMDDKHLEYTLDSSFPGGDGASSGRFENIQIDIPEACRAGGVCAFKMKKGTGGAGGVSVTNSGRGTYGLHGSESMITIERIDDGTIYWGLRMNGAMGGEAAWDDSEGSEAVVTAQKCSLYNYDSANPEDSAWSEYANCSGFLKTPEGVQTFSAGEKFEGGKGAQGNRDYRDRIIEPGDPITRLQQADGLAGHVGNVIIQYEQPM